MQSTLFRLVTAAAIVAMFGCATASNQASSPSDRVIATTDAGILRSHENPAPDSVIDATPAAAFAALEGAYQDLGIDIKLFDPATLQIGNRRFSKMYQLAGVRLSNYLGCGFSPTGPAADSYRVTMSIVSQVTPTGTGSRLDTQVTAYAEDLGSSKGAMSCMTLGTLEQRIHALAAKHAGG